MLPNGYTLYNALFNCLFCQELQKKSTTYIKKLKREKNFKTKWSIYAKQKQRIYLFMNPLCLTFCDLDKQNQLLFTTTNEAKNNKIY